jgi:endonuclease III
VKSKQQRHPSRSLLRRAADLLPWVDARLRKRYRTEALGNKANPLDELIYIQLSVRTREHTYLSTYPALRRLVRGRWDLLRTLPPSTIVRAIRTGGMATVKVGRLRGMLDQIAARLGRVSLAPLTNMTDADAEAFLRSLPGVGPKVARCVLMYSLGRAVFPVDSHCRRVLSRLGMLPFDIDIKASHDFLQALVPTHNRRTLHINLVHHGRATCFPAAPACSRCVLATRCPTGQLRLGKLKSIEGRLARTG